MRWGICSSWSSSLTDPWKIFNARVEFKTGGLFLPLLQKKRVVIPISGFYEFKQLSNGKKQPTYLFNANKDKPLLLAGLCDVWIPKDSSSSSSSSSDAPYGNDGSVSSFVVLTMDACSKIQWLHHRQPIVLDEATARAWLDPNSDPGQVLDRIKQVGINPPLQWHQVNAQMNSIKYQGKNCATDVDQAKGGIKSFFSNSGGNSGSGGNGGSGGSGGSANNNQMFLNPSLLRKDRISKILKRLSTEVNQRDVAVNLFA